jgi:hypothetical protein
MFAGKACSSRLRASLSCWLTACGLLVCVQVAAAQVADIDDSLRARLPTVTPVYHMPRPFYEPTKIELGSFLLSPSVTEMLAGDDNIFANDQHRASDAIFTTNEDATLQSQWLSDSAMLRLDHAYQLYSSHATENANTYGAEGDFRFAVTDSASVELLAAFQQQPQQRNSAQADRLSLHRPIYNTIPVTVSYNQDWNRWHNDLTAGMTQIAYISHVDAQRSAVKWRYRDRLSYALTGDTWSFVQISYSTQDWLLNPDRRNFNTLIATAGVNLQIADIVDAELGAGVLRQQYRFSGFSDLVTPTFSGHLNWNMLPLTTLLISGEKTVTGLETFCDAGNILANPACAALSGGALSILGNQLGALEVTTAEIGLQHEFWHDLLGEIRFRYERDEFDPVNLVDKNYSVNVGSRFLINRNLELDLSYALNIRTANKDLLLYNSGPYQANIVTLALKAAI